MGGALLAGWLREGLDPAFVHVQDPAPATEVAALMASHGIPFRETRLPSAPAVIVLAVKPQIIDDVLPTLASAIGPSTVLLSIAAGRTLANLASHLPPGSAIVRAMPNTCFDWRGDRRLREQQVTRVRRCFATCCSRRWAT
jgi:pyrroline-5-carboxylate reductase